MSILKKTIGTAFQKKVEEPFLVTAAAVGYMLGSKGSKAKAALTNEVENNILNETAISTLNEQSNKAISNIVMEQAKSCEAAALMGQSITLENITVDGDFQFDGNQQQDAAVSLSCVQGSNVKNESALKITDAVIGNLESNDKSNVMSKVDSALKQQSEAGLLSGSSQTESKMNNKIKTNVTNTTNVNMRNILRNHIEKNVNSSDIQNCISNVSMSNDISMKNIKVGGNFVTALSQSQTAKSMTDCIQKAQIANKAIDEFSKEVKLAVSRTTDTTTTAESSMVASQESTATGIAEVFSSLGGVFTGLFGAAMGAMILPLIVGFGIFMVVKNMLPPPMSFIVPGVIIFVLFGSTIMAAIKAF